MGTVVPTWDEYKVIQHNADWRTDLVDCSVCHGTGKRSRICSAGCGSCKTRGCQHHQPVPTKEKGNG